MTTTTLISFILFSVFSFPVVRSTTSIGQEWPCSFSFSTVFTFLIVTTPTSIIQGWPSCFHVFTCMVLASWCFYKRWISMDFTSFHSTEEDIKVESSLCEGWSSYFNYIHFNEIFMREDNQFFNYVPFNSSAFPDTILSSLFGTFIMWEVYLLP